MAPPRARTPFDRTAALERLASEPFDVVVIGGGITGAGVALDAAARGLRTALVEARDFAAGTSSKSSKLVHGGLRYLQQREYFLVYENLAERQRLLQNAPHLVQPLAFLIPLFGRDGAVNKAVAKAYNTALWLYDLTGGLRIGKRHRRVSIDEAIDMAPALRRDRVAAGFLYWDAQADDARLTLAVIRTAVLDHGAIAVNYAPVEQVVREDGRVTGVRLADGTTVTARAVVNATGVWADHVRALDEGTDPHTLRPAKGVHVAVSRAKLPMNVATVVPVPKDRRSIFVVPWGDRVYLGTTDTDYDGPLDAPRCTADDVAYILDAINLFVADPLSEADVLGVWAGLRPLVRSASSQRTADLSRRHTVAISDSGMVTVTGGKLTTYRRMAADTVDAIGGVLGRRLGRSPTKKMRLRGAQGTAELREPGAAARLAVADDVLAHLVDRFGDEARAVIAMLEADPLLAGPLVPGLPYLRAEAVYAARYEMAHTLEDVLARRTRATLLDAEAAKAAAPDVARLLANELGWTTAEVAAQVASFVEEVERDQAAAANATSGAAGGTGSDRASGR